MPTRNSQSQSHHDQMVSYAANFLMGKEYRDVSADLSGFTQPELIFWEETKKGHIPDLTAWADKYNIFEAETADSIFDDHTEDQWKLFAAYAGQHNAAFWVIVPSGSEASANQRLAELGIQAQVWGI